MDLSEQEISICILSLSLVAARVSMLHMFPTTRHLLEIKAALIDFLDTLGLLNKLTQHLTYYHLIKLIRSIC